MNHQARSTLHWLKQIAMQAGVQDAGHLQRGVDQAAQQDFRVFRIPKSIKP